MKGKYLNTLLALIALGLLWGGVYFYNWRQSKKPPPPPPKPEEKVLSVEPAAIQSFTLAPRGSETFTLRKEAGAWTIAEPRALAASSSDVQSFLDSLTGASVDEVVDAKPTDLKQYGLDQPAETVTVSTDTKPSEFTLRLGDETPTTSGVYAQVAGNPRVILIADYLKSALEKSLFDLRDKRVVTLTKDQIERLAVSSKSGSYTLEKSPQGVWQIVLPPPVRADPTAVDSMVDGLEGLSMQSILAEKKNDLTKYGLGKPELTIRLSGAGSAQTLTLGKEENGRYDAMNSALDPVFSVDSSFVSSFTKDPGSLRDKDLFSFSSFEANRVEAKTPKGHEVFVKTKGKWQMAEPEHKAEPSDKMEDLLDSLSELRAQSFPAHNPANLAAYGLTQPTYIFTVSFGEKNQSETVEAATVGEHLYARRATDTVPSELALKALDSTMKALSKL